MNGSCFPPLNAAVFIEKMLLKRNPQGRDYLINMCSSVSNQKPSIQTFYLRSK